MSRLAQTGRQQNLRRLAAVVSCSVCFALALTPLQFSSAAEPNGNLVLVTLDGVRWQEVFGGVDLDLIEDDRFTNDADFLRKKYWHEKRVERRKRLFPFLWSVIESNGVLIGDRDSESYVEVTNPWWFSYPGYNEILTGRADPKIDSNDKNWNANVTLLEVLNDLPEFEGRVAAFASWDVFPYIVNSQRSGVPVNAGFEILEPAISVQTSWLNQVSASAPRIWNTVRLDFITHGYAMETLRVQQPRVLYIAYGETDDFAHDDSYDRYIDAAYRTDRMLAELWVLLQSDAFYKDRTTLIISTDHGRGSTASGWPGHGSSTSGNEAIEGSDQIWLAAIGPRVESKGVVRGNWAQSQIAATALTSIWLDATTLMPIADDPIREILKQEDR
jgi:hypothetical protein